jgi:hypothetical protein
MARKPKSKERPSKIDRKRVEEMLRWQFQEEKILVLRWYLLGSDVLRHIRLPIMWAWAVAEHSPVVRQMVSEYTQTAAR